MRKPLWIPSSERKKHANITRFIGFINDEHDLNIESYNQLYIWSLENISDFWAAIWGFGEIKASQKYEKIVENIEKFPGARWFIGAKLNFAENLLRYKDAHNALVFKGETRILKRTSYLALHDSVARLAKALR